MCVGVLGAGGEVASGGVVGSGGGVARVVASGGGVDGMVGSAGGVAGEVGSAGGVGGVVGSGGGAAGVVGSGGAVAGVVGGVEGVGGVVGGGGDAVVSGGGMERGVVGGGRGEEGAVGGEARCDIDLLSFLLHEAEKYKSLYEEARDECCALRLELEGVRKQGEGRVGDRKGEEENRQEWQVVGKGCGTRVKLRRCEANPGVPVSNTFEVLQQEEGEGGSIAQAVGGKKTGGGRKTGGKGKGKRRVLVVGDSQVRGIDSEFCRADRGSRTVACFPGAGVRDVSVRMDRLLAGEGEEPIVCLSVGGNDVGRVRSEELYRRYEEMLRRVVERGGIPVVCGVLPRKGVGSEWLSRALNMNCRLAEMCRKKGWQFVDNWDRFYGSHHMYAGDGIHMSESGKTALAVSLHSAVNVVGQFFH